MQVETKALWISGERERGIDREREGGMGFLIWKSHCGRPGGFCILSDSFYTHLKRSTTKYQEVNSMSLKETCHLLQSVQFPFGLEVGEKCRK